MPTMPWASILLFTLAFTFPLAFIFPLAFTFAFTFTLAFAFTFPLAFPLAFTFPLAFPLAFTSAFASPNSLPHPTALHCTVLYCWAERLLGLQHWIVCHVVAGVVLLLMLE